MPEARVFRGWLWLAVVLLLWGSGCQRMSPTATRTPSPTATPTATRTPSPTAPPTATRTPSPTAPPTATPTRPPCRPAGAAAVESLVLSLVNGERTRRGLPPLTRHPALEAAAQAHARDMACHNFLSHTGSDGSSVRERMARYGYQPIVRWSENIFMGMDGYNDPILAVNWWMDSEVHRRAILSADLVHIGVGYAYAPARDAGYYVLVFGRNSR